MFQVIIKHLRPFMRKNNNKITLRVTCKASNHYRHNPTTHQFVTPMDTTKGVTNTPLCGTPQPVVTLRHIYYNNIRNATHPSHKVIP